MPDHPPADAGATFTRIDARDLRKISVVAQCLDNQWVSQDLLDYMLNKGLSYEDRAVTRRRLADSRAEYLRALLNSEQVIINRAFLINNPVVYRDFLRDGPQRTAFLRMLDDSVVVPYLATEGSPGQTPRFTVDPSGWSAWRRVLDDAHLHCLRLSWDDGENQRYLRRLMTQRFRRFVGNLAFLDLDALRTDFGLDEQRAAALPAVLREAMVWASDHPEITREMFYERFVVADRSDPALGRFDPAKPFAAVLKQLVDLRYNTNLPDAVDRYPLTPADSLHRTALQEEREERRGAPRADPAELAAALLRRRVFDLVQRPLNVSLTGLELTQVWQARQTDAWYGYAGHLRDLMDHPDEFDVRAQRVYDSYVALATELAELVGERRAHTGPGWQPVIRVVVEVLGATLSVIFSGDPVVEVTGRVAEEVAARGSAAVVRFVVTGRDRRLARSQLATGIQIMRVWFEHTAADWDELVARFRASGLPVVRGDDADDDPAMDGRGDADAD